VRLVCRCDASASTGLGHVARAFALAEELGPRLGVVPLFLARPDPLVEAFLDARPVELRAVEAPGYARDEVLAAAGAGDVVVSDSYDLDANALRALGDRGVRHAVVDDFATLPTWPCELVVNPNPGARTDAYAGAGCVLVGPRYALLRRELRAAGRLRSARERADRLLVCLGGGDWGPRGRRLVEALAGLAARGVSLRAATDDAALPPGVDRVSPRSLPEQLGWADLAVLSGGTLKYEAAAAGVPMLLVAAVEHQRAVAQAFAAAGGGSYLGALADVDPEAVAADAARLLAAPERLAASSEAARRIVDGLGAVRAADALLGPESDSVSLARLGDARQ
jgi:spore coat polysaccharide biosynthesis predicted glycosyltransferase SpsG